MLSRLGLVSKFECCLDSSRPGSLCSFAITTRRPPVWFGDFVVGGNLDQSFTGSQQSNKQLKVVSMVQQQLDQQPLELTDMWHDNDEERKEKRLPGERLDISWVSTSPKRLLQTDFAMLPLKKSSVE